MESNQEPWEKIKFGHSLYKRIAVCELTVTSGSRQYKMYLSLSHCIRLECFEFLEEPTVRGHSTRRALKAFESKELFRISR